MSDLKIKEWGKVLETRRNEVILWGEVRNQCISRTFQSLLIQIYRSFQSFWKTFAPPPNPPQNHPVFGGLSHLVKLLLALAAVASCQAVTPGYDSTILSWAPQAGCLVAWVSLEVNRWVSKSFQTGNPGLCQEGSMMPASLRKRSPETWLLPKKRKEDRMFPNQTKPNLYDYSILYCIMMLYYTKTKENLAYPKEPLFSLGFPKKVFRKP